MLESYRELAGEAVADERRREVDARLDEAHVQRTAEWIAALERREAEPAAAFAFARRLVNSARLDDAERILLRLVEQTPMDPQAHYWLGQIYLRTQRFERGLDYLGRSVELAPDNLALQLELGRAHSIAGNAEEAESIYRRVVEEANDERVIQEARRQLSLVRDVGALLGRAITLEEAERFEQAERLYRRLIDSDEIEGLEARFRLGRMLLGLERYDEAIAALGTFLTEAREVAPGGRLREAGALLSTAHEARTTIWIEDLARDDVDTEAALDFGRRLVNIGRLDLARQVLEPLVARVPDDPQAHYWLGQVYLRMERFEEGLASLERSTELAPENVTLKMALAQAYEAAGERGRAEAVYLEIDELAPETSMAREARRRLNLGRAQRLIEASDWEGALEIFTRLLEEHPDDPRLLEQQARMYEALGREAELEEVLQELLARAPRDIGLLMRTAASYERRGRGTQAQEIYVRILGLEPDAETTRLALDRLGFGRAVELLQAGDFAEAATVLEQLQTVAPRVPMLPLNLGIAYYGQQRHEEAEAAFRRTLSLDENNLAARVQLAQLLDETGRLGESIEMMELALGLTRTPQQNQQVRQRLNALYAREVDRVIEGVMRGETGFDALMGLARKLFQRQFDAEVTRLLGPMLERFQDEPQIHFWLGRALLRQGGIDRGVAAIERSVELEPGNVALLAELGQAYLRAERWEDADRILGQVAQQAPDADTFERADRNRRLARARGLEQDGDFEAALALYETMVEEQPDEQRLLLGQARMLLALNRGDEADAILEPLLAQDPEDVGFRLHLGSLYQQYGYPDRHEQMLLEALDLAPDNVQVRANLGRLYLQSGRIEDGLEHVELAFDRLRQLGPEQPQVVELANSLTDLLLRLGRGLTDQGQLDEAEQVLDRLVTIQPRNAQALYWLSKVYHDQEAFGREVEALEQVVEAMPENLLMQRRLGLAYYHAEQQEQAIEALNAVLERFPFDSEVRYLLAETHRQSGAQATAEAEYARLLELNPGEEWRLKALDRLGLARVEEHLDQNRSAQALELLRELLQVVPDDPLVNLALARAYHLADREDEAEMQYRRVLSLAPEDPDARLGLAGLLADIDREDEAIETYHALAMDDPMLPQAEEARASLDEILLQKARRNLADAGTEADPAARIARLLPLGIDLFELQGYAAALVVFEYLVGVAPDDAPSHYWLGRVYQEQGRQADAMVVLRHSVELEPGNPRYLTALGIAYREEQLFRLAEEVLEQAKSLDPEDIEIGFELAELHQRRDRTDDAEAELLRIIEIAPDDEAVHRALAQLDLPEDPAQLDGERLDAARDLLSALPPGELRAPAANLYLAEIYRRHDRLADAEAAWRAVLAQEPGHPRAALALGRLYRETGRDDEAVALLSGVADGDGPQPLRREARVAVVELLTQQSQAMIDRLESGDEGDPDAARALGMALIQRQAFEDAVTLLEAAVVQFPDDPQLHYWRGRAYRFVNRPNEGLAALARSAGLAPDNMQLRHEFGVALQDGRRVADARAIFEQVAVNAEDPELQQDATRRAAHMRALQHVDAGDFASALQEIDATLNRFPADVSLLGERGRILLQLGRVDEADRTFEHILSIEPESIGVRMRLAGVYRARGETAKFLEQLAAVIAIAPESPQAAQARAQLGYNRGLELVEEEDIDGAQEIFERMLTVVPNDPAARFQLGRVYFLQRRLGEAEIHLIEVTQDDPGHQGAHLILGRVYEVMERWDNAMRSYERAVDLGAQTREGNEALTELTRLYNMRLQELMTTGREDDAIRGMQRIVDNNPGNFAARMQLARLLFSTGRFDEGLEHMREVVRLRPGALPYRLMAAAYRQTGRLREAVEAYANAIALETNPDQASELALELVLTLTSQMQEESRPFAAIRHLQALHDSGLGSERSWFPLGVIYRQQGVFDEAARAFREALRTAPDNVTIRFNLAELYQRTNDEELALIQYRDIVRRGEPGNRFVEEARRRADQLRDRVALFTSQLGYTMTIGESVIQEQDLTSTGAINSSFSSQLFYNLGTNFRPTDNFTLRLDTGFSYIGNHSTRTDSLIPRVGVSGDLNLNDHFYRASLHVSDNWDLMREAYLGRSINASASGGIRFTDPLALFRGWGGGRVTETGESRLQYAPAERFISVLPEANPGLRNLLRAQFEEISEAGVDDAMQFYQEGRRLLRQGRLESALDSFGRVLEIVPEDPLTHLGIGLIHQRRGEDDAAAEAYRVAMNDAIAARPARLQLAELQAGIGQLDAAAMLLEPLANDDVDTPERALAQERLRDYSAREDGLTVAEAHRTALDAAGFGDALDDLRSGRYRQALETLEGMLEAFPEDPLVWLNIGVARQRLDEATQAEAAFQRVLDISPRNLNGQLRLGMLYADTGRPGRALTLLQRVASEGAGLEIGARARDELERLERERLRTLTGDGIEQGAPASKTLQWRLFYSDTILPVTSLSETFGYGAGLTFAYSSLDYGNWSLNYTFGVRDNKEPLGIDYAYLSHDFGLSWQTRVPNFRVFGSLFGTSENIPGLSASLSLSRQQREYLNVDTNALNVLGRAVQRSHVTNNISAALNYQIPGHDRMSFSLSYSIGVSDTDLPVGIVFNRQGTPIAFQSTGLGAFDTSFLSLGMNFRF
jgi:tetratricopeptide (TPR) repeat protein